MAHLEFSKQIMALLVIDPQNEFISADPPSIYNRTTRIRTERKALVVINSRIVDHSSITR